MWSADTEAVGVTLKRSAAGIDGATLSRKFSRSVRDNIVAECLIQAVRVSGMIVLARALGAAEFGILRVLMVVAAFATTILQPGLTEALVQRKNLNPVHEATAWFVSAVLGLAGALLIYASASIVSEMMLMPRLTSGIRLICAAIFLDCLAVTSNAHLQRELRFGTLAAAEVAAEFAFLATALALLWVGRPRWSLMAGLTARLGIRAIFLLIAAPRPPRTWPTMAALRDLRRFAAGVWGGNIVSIISANADFLLVGRLLGASALGFYMLAWDLLRFVPDRLYKVAGRVAFPAFCLIQDDDAELGRGYRNFIEYIGKLVLPVAACAAVAAPELIGTVYGPKWLPAAQPLRLLSLGLGLLGLRTGIGSVYFAKGHPVIDIYLHSARLVMIVAAVFSLSRLGLVGISAGMSGVEALISIAGLLIAISLVKLRPADLLKAAMPGLRLAVACAFAAAAGKVLATACGAGGVWALLFVALPAGAIFVWIEGKTIISMVAGAIDLNKTTAPQLSQS